MKVSLILVKLVFRRNGKILWVARKMNYQLVAQNLGKTVRNSQTMSGNEKLSQNSLEKIIDRYSYSNKDGTINEGPDKEVSKERADWVSETKERANVCPLHPLS